MNNEEKKSGREYLKIARQSKILELIEENVIETQDDLAQKLLECKFKVTQATVSRDIKELRLIKTMSNDGRYHYAPFKDSSVKINERIVNVFRESVIKIDHSGNMIVVKTLAGTAMAASVAIDSMEWPEVVGCLAGDDTIFVVVRHEDRIAETVEKFKKLMK